MSILMHINGILKSFRLLEVEREEIIEKWEKLLVLNSELEIQKSPFV